jgi:hypothetical protein
VKEIIRLRPALVIAANSFNYEPHPRPADAGAAWTTGWTRTHDILVRAGAQVVTIADTPYMGVRVPTCLAERPKRIDRCNRRLDAVLRGPEQRASLTAVAGRNGTVLIDPVPWMCSTVCPAVLGNVLVYRDSNHLSTAFTATLLPLLVRALPAPR